jgi:hypothetical protein
VELNSTKLLPVLSEELREELARVGFSDIQLLGNLNGETFNPLSSGDLIALATFP